ncbi:MAG TPA: glycosyltransferase [Stellaceae bacterium]
MKVLVLNTMTPFGWGGAEELAFHLTKNLNAAGADAEQFRIPFQWNPPERLIESMLFFRGLRTWNVDRMIAFRFPAYLMPHDNKVLWVIHQFRQAYDLWDAGMSNIEDSERGREIRATIKRADEMAFAEAVKIFTNHQTTADRLKHYNGWDGEVLLPPLNDPELFMGGERENYILASGRVNSGKRQYLLVEAMAHSRSNVRLVIAGPPDSPGDADALRALVAERGLSDRVSLDLRFLPREKLADYVNRAFAVAYMPYDEDGIGYVTMEAANAGKPVITLGDSGGVLDLVKDGETGRVCEPTAEALAAAIDDLVGAPARSLRLGEQARTAWAAREITWAKTIERLLA